VRRRFKDWIRVEIKYRYVNSHILIKLRHYNIRNTLKTVITQSIQDEIGESIYTVRLSSLPYSAQLTLSTYNPPFAVHQLL